MSQKNASTASTPHKSSQRPLKKAKRDPELSQASLIEDLEAATIKPNGSVIDEEVQMHSVPVDTKQQKAKARLARIEESCSISDESTDCLSEDQFIEIFRQEAQSWLLDHGKAFFHVEALGFLREQERKTKKVGSDTDKPIYGFGKPRR